MSFQDSVLICDEVDAVLNKILIDNGLKVSYEPEITPEQILEKISNFNIIKITPKLITKEMIDKADNCKIIARVGVGLDNVDQVAAKAKNIRVINAVEGAMNAVAELVLGFMLSLARQTGRGDRAVRDGKWLKKELKGTELRGKYLGIIGLGNIGKRLARLARGLNMNIIGYDVMPIDEEFAKEVATTNQFEDLIKTSDYISIHVPLLDSTYHLLDAQKMSTMKKTAKIINTVPEEV